MHARAPRYAFATAAVLAATALTACGDALLEPGTEYVSDVQGQAAARQTQVPGVVWGGLMSSRQLLERHVIDGLPLPGNNFIEFAINAETLDNSGVASIRNVVSVALDIQGARIDGHQIIVPYTAVVDAMLFYPVLPDGAMEPVLNAHPIRLVVSSSIWVAEPPPAVMRSANEFRVWLAGALIPSITFPPILAIFYRIDENGVPVQVTVSASEESRILRSLPRKR